MKKIVQEAEHIYAALKEQLSQEDEFSSQEPARKTHQAFMYCGAALKRVEELIRNGHFDDLQEEIYFFRHIKPLILSEFLYRAKLVTMYKRRPKSGRDAVRKQLLKMQRNVMKKFRQHEDFYSYCQSGSTYRDELYFVYRADAEPAILLLDFFIVKDRTTTGYDILLGELLANERLADFLEAELAVLAVESGLSDTPKGSRPTPQWTHTKASVVELVYAFHEWGCLNNGEAKLADIAEGFKRGFGIDVSDYARTWISIKARKGDHKSSIRRLLECYQQALVRNDSD